MASGVGVSVMVGVIDGVAEGCVAVGVKVTVTVGVFVENIPAKGLLLPLTTVIMIKMPTITNTPAKPPSK